jgi:glycosyltransferase involved in cell wall biosynthesis
MKLLLATSSISYNGGGISSYGIDFLKLMAKNNECFVVSGDIINDDNKYLVKESYKLVTTDFSVSNVNTFLNLIDEIKPDIIVNSNFQLMSVAIPYIDFNIIKISISHFVDGELAKVAGFNHIFYTAIIALSLEGKKFLDYYYKINEKNKVVVIYNFYEISDANIHKISNDPVVITFPGGSSLHKNPILVYSLLILLQKSNLAFKFYWLGDTKLPGNRLFKTGMIKDLIKKDERIVFTGLIPRLDANAIINNTNVFLLPSKKEGCPISLLEAISSGVIPIIADSKHASSELIINGKSGLILNEKGVNSYFELISNIINNHIVYENIYLNSRKLHHEKLSEFKWQEQMMKLFKELPENNEFLENIFKNKKYKNDKFKLKKVLLLERGKQISRSTMVLLFFLREKIKIKVSTMFN